MFSATSIAMASLKQSEGEHASLGMLLLASLNRSESDANAVLTARLVDGFRDHIPQNWARCDQDILLHIDVIDSQSQIFAETRLNDLAQSLDAAEPILNAVESATGFLLDPIQMINILPSEHIIIEISRFNEVDRILLAFPHEFEGRRRFESSVRNQALNVSTVPVACSLLIKGPMMDVDTLADVSGGDLLLLGGGSVLAVVAWQMEDETQASVDGVYDLTSGQFSGRLGGDGAHGVSLYEQENAHSIAVGISTAFPVRLTACIRGFTATAGDLAALQSGSFVHIGPLTPGIHVALSFNEKEICYGELVQIADQFAVLVENNEYALQEAAADDTDVSGVA